MSSGSLPLSPAVREIHDRYLQAQTRRRLDEYRPLSREAARIIAEFLTDPAPRDGDRRLAPPARAQGGPREPAPGTTMHAILVAVRECGPVTAKDVALAIDVPVKHVAANLRDLEIRRYVTTRGDTRPYRWEAA